MSADTVLFLCLTSAALATPPAVGVWVAHVKTRMLRNRTEALIRHQDAVMRARCAAWAARMERAWRLGLVEHPTLGWHPDAALNHPASPVRPELKG